MSQKWDDWFMGLARYVATASKDPSKKVGAVIVAKDDRRKVAFGFNGFPPGIADTSERLNNREVKYKLVQHAERNALDNATFDCRGATMYQTMFPCCECAKSIISKGVARVVCLGDPDFEARWADSVAFARSMLAEAGVQIDQLPESGDA